MAGNIESDAMPIPEAKPKFAEVPPSPVNNKEQKQKPTRKLSSSSSSDSDFEDSSTNNRGKGGIPGTVININKAQDVHIGHRFNYTNYQSCVYQKYTESDYSDSSPINTNDKGPRPAEELLRSEREIDTHDMYIVAENVSRSWKKLARFLPPKNVFSNGQLKTFEDNNPRDQVEAIIEMLNAWRQQHPKYATIGVLAETLWDIGRGDISQKLHL